MLESVSILDIQNDQDFVDLNREIFAKPMNPIFFFFFLYYVLLRTNKYFSSAKILPVYCFEISIELFTEAFSIETFLKKI